MQRLRLARLKLLKSFGLLAAARYLTRNRLRILCYHGISIGDQHEFEPLLFMRRGVFDKRMARLRKQGWRIVSLETAVEELSRGAVPDRTVVVTIDDGWVSTLEDAAPVLVKYGIAATVYVTTYYAERSADVFNVALYYMLWKSKLSEVNLETGIAGIDGRYKLDDGRFALGKRWVDHVENILTWEQRQDLLSKIATALGHEPEEILSGDRFRILNSTQVQGLVSQGLDVQLHTHRHRLPTESYQALEQEVLDNKRLLEQWTGRVCDHFCYPSGIYSAQQSNWLAQMGLKSSTTCDPGINRPGIHLHRLRRILDRDTWSELEFDVAMSGLSDLVGFSKASAEHHR